MPTQKVAYLSSFAKTALPGIFLCALVQEQNWAKTIHVLVLPNFGSQVLSHILCKDTFSTTKQPTSPNMH
jgi:hypothetical protein